mmetsp:Transcript_52222/g.124504  ORF Transcript_52222/g.124504 Transcript_52222/m.124504 type:complete len:265 (-) Transcript_52222:417-1211(-)
MSISVLHSGSHCCESPCIAARNQIWQRLEGGIHLAVPPLCAATICICFPKRAQCSISEALLQLLWWLWEAGTHRMWSARMHSLQSLQGWQHWWIRLRSKELRVWRRRRGRRMSLHFTGRLWSSRWRCRALIYRGLWNVLICHAGVGMRRCSSGVRNLLRWRLLHCWPRLLLCRLLGGLIRRQLDWRIPLFLQSPQHMYDGATHIRWKGLIFDLRYRLGVALSCSHSRDLLCGCSHLLLLWWRRLLMNNHPLDWGFVAPAQTPAQ